LEAYPLKNFELDSGFRRRDEKKKGFFHYVIPAQAGIQDKKNVSI